eukprot:6501646-Prymnesium_polylepis.1
MSSVSEPCSDFFMLLSLWIALSTTAAAANSNPPLLEAAMAGDAAKVTGLLQGGADPNFPASGGKTALQEVRLYWNLKK